MGEKTKKQKLILGIQHVLAMFGATVLVPALTGLDTSITLFCAGIGTLIFHLVTKKKVPVFLGSSFAFMGGIIAVIVGFIVSLPLGFCDFSKVASAEFFSFTDQNIVQQLLLLPAFKIDAILAIAPIALVTLIEHVGDITTNSAVVGNNFMVDPGIHRTVLGDGLATAFAGLLGGPANTTYGENTGVLAVTKVYDPSVIRVAAVIAVILGIFGKFGGVISSIPSPVSGAISIVLYGMISAVGVRILVNNRLNFGNSRNLMIAALILVLGIGCDSIPVSGTVTISGLALAAIVGIVLAIILPEGEDGRFILLWNQSLRL